MPVIIAPNVCRKVTWHPARVATAGKGFQVVIERHARLALDVQPGDRAIEVVDGNRLTIFFAPGPHPRSLRGRLRGSGTIENFAAYRGSDALPAAVRREPGE